MKDYKFFVAGVQYHELKEIINEVEVGDELNLSPESTNPYDSNAIRIEWEDSAGAIMLGYVPKKFSAEITAMMEIYDLECEVVDIKRSAKPWEQLKVRIYNAEEEEQDG